MPLSFVDLARVKRYLGIAAGDTSDDELLGDLAGDFEGTALRITNGRRFGENEYELQLDGNGDTELVLPQYPIDEVTEVKIDDNLQFGDGILAEVEDEHFTVDKEAGMLIRLDGVWPEGRRNIRVQWTVSEEVPNDVHHAASIAIADSYTRGKQLESGQSGNEMLSETITGGRSEQYKSELDPEWGIPILAVQRLLRYRNAV